MVGPHPRPLAPLPEGRFSLLASLAQPPPCAGEVSVGQTLAHYAERLPEGTLPSCVLARQALPMRNT
jgi:hypothetical protein